VYTSLQRPKLLLGGEREASLYILYLTFMFIVFALFGLSWRMGVLAILCGTVLQWVNRTYSQTDPDYFKILLAAWRHPHIRNPE
jgi:type IV secretory pathway TrbD component